MAGPAFFLSAASARLLIILAKKMAKVNKNFALKSTVQQGMSVANSSTTRTVKTRASLPRLLSAPSVA